LRHKYDVRVLGRLRRLLGQRQIDAVVTVGAGDKMFWGRLAAWLAHVPVICSALHSTGLPDHVEWLNRLLAPMTDAFVAVAGPHGRHLAEHEGCPAARIEVIPNGVDMERFQPGAADASLRGALGLPQAAPVAGIVAALRPEKQHELFLHAADLVHRQSPECRFLIVGDGPRRAALETLAGDLGLAGVVHFLGARDDVPQLLALLDVFVLTSKMETSPVSILEAMACGKPVVATRVGSVPQTVVEGRTGYLVAPGSADELAARILELLSDPGRAKAMGQAGRQEVVAHGSIGRMVEGYQAMLTGIYRRKAGGVK
jgi:glycosyltransferase involved in cell wall biosynthesis